MKAKRFLLTTLALVLVAAISITGTIAFLRTEEQTVSNVFTVGDDISIKLEENVDHIRNGENLLKNVSNVTDKGQVTYNNVLPGDKLGKQIIVTNTGSVAAYVKVIVTINNASAIDAAIAGTYGSTEYGYSEAAIQAMYDYIFNGWNVDKNFNVDTVKNGVLPAETEKVDNKYVITYYLYLPENGNASTLTEYIQVPQEFTYEQLKMFNGLNIDVAASAIQADNIDNTNALGTDAHAKAAFAYLAEIEGKGEPDNDLVGEPEYLIATETQLIEAFAEGGNFVLANNVAVDETVEIPAGADVNLDLAGNTLTGNVMIEDGASLTAKNGTIDNNDDTVSAIQTNGGDLVLEKVEVKSARHGVRVEGGKVIIRDGYYAVEPTGKKTVHALNVSDGGEVEIYGGTFVGPKGTAADSGAAVNVQAGSTVTIYGGNFSGGKNNTLSAKGTLTVYGGTFDQNPAAFVATGYKAIENNGKYYVVADTVDEVVSTPAEFESALSDAAAAGSGDNTIYLLGDINLGGAAWTPIKVDGYNGAGVVTVEGNGATIKGLTAPLFAGGFAGKSGIVIKNLTIADSNIVSTSGLGGGAFIDSADSMHKLTLENCHLINSTVSGERTGGLIGWCTGYAKLNDGPVKAYVTISDCSVIDSTIIGAGSAGAIAGHPGASDYTYTTIEDCEVKNVKVISNDTGSWRTGAIVGTANNGHVIINNVDVENVTLTQNGVTAETTVLYGRFVPSGTGTLVIDGVSYVTNNDALKAAIANGESTVALESGSYDLNGIQKDGLTLIGVGKDVNVANTTKYASGSAVGAIWKAINLKNVTITNTVYTMADGGNATFTNVNFAAGFRQGYGKAVVFNDCTFGSNSEGYALHFQTDSASEGGVITLNGCEFEGGKVHLGGKRAYAFTGCDFAAGTDFQVWSNITLDGCTVDGVKVTVDNVDTLFPNLDMTKVTIK